MSFIIDKNTRLLVQGITGKEGLKSAKEMKAYGTKVIAGVTPGKGGQEAEGIPVFNTVKEALEKFPEINATLIYVPPTGAKDAVIEAISNGIKLAVVFTEKISMLDTATMFAYAKKNNARVIGPSSVGIISPGKAKIGSIGGGNPDRVFAKGNAALLSKSGGMTSEIAWILKQAGIGISTAAGLGGDMIACTTFADLLPLVHQDHETKALVIFGEIGGTYEQELAQKIKETRFKKPVVAFISGAFAETVKSDVTLGHAGAIISDGGNGSSKEKKEALLAAGVKIAEIPDDIPLLIKKALAQ